MNIIVRRTATALLAAFVLIGCGGGSGGGSPGGSSGGANPAENLPPSPITLSRPGPISIRGTAVVGGYMAAPPLTGTVTGNLASLYPNDVHFDVTDSQGLFQGGNFYLDTSVTPATYRAIFFQENFTTPGHFAGSLRLRLCLDRACTQPFSGAPIVVPYDVTVQAGLALSRSVITVSAPFGTVPASETVDVTTSIASTGWTANRTTPEVLGFRSPRIDVVDPGLHRRTGNQLQLRFLPERPGEYIETFKVSAYTSYPGNSPVNPGREFVETITVRYVVTPNPAVDIVFFPASLDITQKQETLNRYYPHYFTTNTDVRADFDGIEYLTSAGNAGPYNSWFDESALQSLHTCHGPPTACLVPGLYTARLRYRLTTASGARLVYFPINLTVTK